MAHEARLYGPGGGGHDDDDDEEFYDPAGPHDHDGEVPEGADDEGGEAGGMAALVETLRDIAGQAGYNPDVAVQMNKLRIVLEAVGGDLDLAATLYWDDFLATANHQGAAGGGAGRSADRNHEGGRNRQEDFGGEFLDNANPLEHADAAEGLLNAQPPEPEQQQPDPPAPLFGGRFLIDDNSPLVRRLDDTFRRLDESAQNLWRQRAGRAAVGGNAAPNAARANVPRPPRPPQQPPPPLEDAGDGEGRDRVRRSARVAAAAAASLPQAAGRGDIQRPRQPSRQGREAQPQGGVEEDGGRRSVNDSGNRVRRQNGQERAFAAGFPGARALLHVADELGNDENSRPTLQGDEFASLKTNPTLRSAVKTAMHRHKKRDNEEVDADGRPEAPSRPEAKRRRSETSPESEKKSSARDGRASTNARVEPKVGPGDEYLSDDDWIWEGTSDLPSSSRKSRGDVDSRPELGPPTELLWGLSEGLLTSDSIGGSHRSSSKETSNVIKDDQEEPSVDADDEEATSGIPRTWLAAGFALSDCSTALCVKPPSEDDLGFFSWKRQIQRNAPPPPYHCRSLSAVLSIVTATILTGASIQAGRVTTSSSKPLFFEMSEEQRKREFEDRLADALSAILLIAVEASVARKKRALKAACAEFGGRIPSDEVEKVTWNKLQHRLGLVPTCSWDTDPNTGDIRFEDDSPVQVVTTLTHVEDIRCYVLSNIKSFMSSGGVALFLETLLRIHGTGAIGQMLHRRGRSDFLIRCTCEERHATQIQEMQQKSLGLGAAGALKADSSPHGAECVSVQLVSLLLTGKVHHSWQGWDTGPLGFGLLTNPTDATTFVDKRLSRPKKPVWVLVGPTCYSVTHMVGCPDRADEFSIRDYPGTVAHMRHWNVWYGQRRLTNFRLTVGRSDESSAQQGNSMRVAATTTRSELPSVRVLKERMQARVRSDIDRSGVESVDPELMFTQEELDRVLVHPDDPKFYPTQFRLWRFDLEQPETQADDSSALEQKQRARTWTPFCRLVAREKQLVETKFGPAIRRILLTRWPQSSTLDRFEPDDPAPVV